MKRINSQEYFKLKEEKAEASKNFLIYYYGFGFAVVTLIIGALRNIFFKSYFDSFFLIFLTIVTFLLAILTKQIEHNYSLKLEIIKLGGKIK